VLPRGEQHAAAHDREAEILRMAAAGLSGRHELTRYAIEHGLDSE
jgi:hypothetical protein